MNADQLKPGTVIEWRQTPDWSVFTRLTIHGRGNEFDKLWVSHEDGTRNLLTIRSILENGRLASPLPCACGADHTPPEAKL